MKTSATASRPQCSVLGPEHLSPVLKLAAGTHADAFTSSQNPCATEPRRELFNWFRPVHSGYNRFKPDKAIKWGGACPGRGSVIQSHNFANGREGFGERGRDEA
jgi:hypothetical protein